MDKGLSNVKLSEELAPYIRGELSSMGILIGTFDRYHRVDGCECCGNRDEAEENPYCFMDMNSGGYDLYINDGGKLKKIGNFNVNLGKWSFAPWHGVTLDDIPVKTVERAISNLDRGKIETEPFRKIDMPALSFNVPKIKENADGH